MSKKREVEDTSHYAEDELDLDIDEGNLEIDDDLMIDDAIMSEGEDGPNVSASAETEAPNSDAESVISDTHEPQRRSAEASVDKDKGAPSTCFSSSNGWARMQLSKPLLKALHDLHFTTPTIIQRDAIPLALQGRDILGTAQTGSGKTAAFLLPIIERLCRSPSLQQRRMTANGPVGGGVATKALILLPTRELSVQCFDMLESLAKYTPVTKVLVTGGMSLKSQETSFRHQPDIVVATPGRVLDLLLNSPSVHLELLEIVVLDEADRLLELGFRDECLRVLKHCSPARQTLLFSATLSDAIKDLAALSLRRPLRVDASSSHTLPSTLEQVLVPVPTETTEPFLGREASLLHLCFETYKAKRIIVFFRTKKGAHRAALIFRLLGIPHAELHGNLTQANRLEALEKFHNSKSVRFLLCSELAARGLDISNIEVVINFQVPPDSARYVHQVGRTARIGRHGIAVTLFMESEKKAIKKIIKTAMRDAECTEPMMRTLGGTVIEKWEKKIRGLESQIKKILHEEFLERELRLAEMEVTKLQNLRDHDDEIMARPKKRWFLETETPHSIGTVKNGTGDEGSKRLKLSEEERLLSQIEKAERCDDSDEEDNVAAEEDDFVDDDGSEVDSGVDTDIDDENVESDAATSKTSIKKNPVEKPVVKGKTSESIPTTSSTKKSMTKGSRQGDEKNRHQKGKGNERRMTAKQKAVLVNQRVSKSIGRKIKKSKLLRRRNSDNNALSDDDDFTQKKKKKKHFGKGKSNNKKK